MSSSPETSLNTFQKVAAGDCVGFAVRDTTDSTLPLFGHLRIRVRGIHHVYAQINTPPSRQHFQRPPFLLPRRTAAPALARAKPTRRLLRLAAGPAC